MTDQNRSQQSRNTHATGRKAETTEIRFEVHELNLTRLERDFKKAEDAYHAVKNRKADGELAQAQKTLDLEDARITLREIIATTHTIAGEALEDTRSFSVNPPAKPMRLDDNDAATANVRMPLVNAEADGLDLDAIYIHLENTMIHDEKGLMYCWILAAERRIKEVRASNAAGLPEVQRDMADLSGLVRRSKERLQDKRNDGVRERAVKIATRAHTMNSRARRAKDFETPDDQITPEQRKYAFVGEKDVKLPPLG